MKELDTSDTANKTEKKKSTIRDTFDSIVVAFVIAMLIKAFIFGAYKIPSGSMLDTLLIGDHILVNKLAYIFSDPKVDDVIVFEYPMQPYDDYIKRVVGVAGDKIKITDKKLYRNGELIETSFAKFSSSFFLPEDIAPRDNVREFVVPENSYFVMGDNRDSSFDARFWGFVDKDLVIGKAVIIYWSSAESIRFERIAKLIR